MVMWSNRKLFSVNFLFSTKWFTESKRTAFILRRTRELRLNKLGSVSPKKIKKQGFYYELVEDTNTKKKPPVHIVLTQDVPGVGNKGEKIEMNLYIAYRDLLLPKLGVYANSVEAKDFLKVSEEKQYSSIYSKIVKNYLTTQGVQIILSNDVQWTLQPWHVKFALRKNGILTNEDCITIPQKISGPNPEIENRDFLIYLTMNKSETFPVRCRIFHWSTSEPSLNQKSFDLNSQNEPLFADEGEKIDLLLKIAQEVKKMENVKEHKTVGKQKKK